MAVFDLNEKRDDLGVFSLADRISSIGVDCAYAMLDEGSSPAVTALASKAIEGISVNTLFSIGPVGHSAFLGERATVLSGPVFSIRPSVAEPEVSLILPFCGSYPHDPWNRPVLFCPIVDPNWLPDSRHSLSFPVVLLVPV